MDGLWKSSDEKSGLLMPKALNDATTEVDWKGSRVRLFTDRRTLKFSAYICILFWHIDISDPCIHLSKFDHTHRLPTANQMRVWNPSPTASQASISRRFSARHVHLSIVRLIVEILCINRVTTNSIFMTSLRCFFYRHPLCHLFHDHDPDRDRDLNHILQLSKAAMGLSVCPIFPTEYNSFRKKFSVPVRVPCKKDGKYQRWNVL